MAASSSVSSADLARIERLEETLGFHFTDRRRVLSALTHSSFLHEHRGESGVTDNERLEFLGDAVVDLAVGLRLMQKHPRAAEGVLSRLRSEIVDERGLSAVARQIGLGKLLRMGKGEAKTGGADRPSLLADAMEAVLAAVFLEGGLDAVLAIVDNKFGALFEQAVTGESDVDFKSAFQEWTQAHLKITPTYRLVSEEGPVHDRLFCVVAEVAGKPEGHGCAHSKKEAERQAARMALEALRQRAAAGSQDGSPEDGAGAGAEEASRSISLP
jgi:ribonuclease III, bacterial